MYNIDWAKVIHSGGGFFTFYGKFEKGWFVTDTDDIIHVYSEDTSNLIAEWYETGDSSEWEQKYEKKGQEFSSVPFLLEALDVIKQDPNYDKYVVDGLYDYYLKHKND